MGAAVTEYPRLIRPAVVTWSDAQSSFNEQCMPAKFQVGDCVRVPDGRIGRVRARVGRDFRVRVRRLTSATHQFLLLPSSQLRAMECPKGWMSPAGYRRYLGPTLAKLRARARARKSR